MITFHLMGYKGLKILQYVNDNYHDIIDLIVIGHDYQVCEDYSGEIKQLCKQNNIPHMDNTDISIIDSKYHIAISWKWLIKLTSDKQLIVFHDSLLPKMRGFNPLVTSLINGDNIVGVTALFGADKYDSGRIIDSEFVEIEYPIKIIQAIHIVSDCYVKLCKRIVEKIATGGEIHSYDQAEDEATYSLWRDEDDYWINWHQSSSLISRFVDAVGYPYKGAKTSVDKVIIHIMDVTPVVDKEVINRTPGKVIFKDGDKPIVVCGRGLLRIDRAIDMEEKQIDFNKKFRIRFK
jgi:methionyl-tRNA formyltransferase